MGSLAARASRAAARPRWVKIAGWMPAAISRRPSSAAAGVAERAVEQIPWPGAASDDQFCWASWRLMIVLTNCCWAPSCRSRVTRRRAASKAVIMRAREAISSDRAVAFETAVPISSAKLARRRSVPGGSGSGWSVPAIRAPQTLPSTMTGAPTSDLMPSSRSRAASRPGMAFVAVDRGPALASADVGVNRLSVQRQAGAGRDVGSALAPARHGHVDLVGVNWARLTLAAPMSRPVTSQTASNTARGSAPRATSVATSRSAACSSASRRSS